MKQKKLMTLYITIPGGGDLVVEIYKDTLIEH